MDKRQDKQQETLLQQRIQGFLPQIDIAGDRYFIDIRLQELRSVEAPNTVLSFHQMERDDLFRKYFFFYDKATKSIYPEDQLQNIPEGVVAIAMPYDRDLDPVGFARKHNYSIEETLKEYPLKKGLKAAVLAVDEQVLQYPIAARATLLLIGIGMDPEQEKTSLSTSVQEQQKAIKKPVVNKKHKGKHL